MVQPISSIILTGRSRVFLLPDLTTWVVATFLEDLVWSLSAGAQSDESLPNLTSFFIKTFGATFLLKRSCTEHPVEPGSGKAESRYPQLTNVPTSERVSFKSDQVKICPTSIPETEAEGIEMSRTEKQEFREEQIQRTSKVGGWWSCVPGNWVFLRSVFPYESRKCTYAADVMSRPHLDCAPGLLAPLLLLEYYENNYPREFAYSIIQENNDARQQDVFNRSSHNREMVAYFKRQDCEKPWLCQAIQKGQKRMLGYFVDAEDMLQVQLHGPSVVSAPGAYHLDFRTGRLAESARKKVSNHDESILNRRRWVQLNTVDADLSDASKHAVVHNIPQLSHGCHSRIGERGPKTTLLMMNTKEHDLCACKKGPEELNALVRSFNQSEDERFHGHSDDDDLSATFVEPIWQFDGQSNSKYIEGSNSRKRGFHKRFHDLKECFSKKSNGDELRLGGDEGTNDNSPIQVVSPRPTDSTVVKAPNRRSFTMRRHSCEARRG